MSEEIRRGAIVRRGDTGTLAMVISNDMLHQGWGRIILCSIILAPEQSEHPTAVAIGDSMTVLPFSLISPPRSAVSEVLGVVSSEQLDTCERILRACTSP